MRRAVLGGSFDPVHRGHVEMARAVLNADLADLVHIIPAWRSPFKNTSSASGEDRLAMVRLAFSKFTSIQIDPMEIQKETISYTLDSLRKLSDLYPNDSLSLIIGADNISGLPQWHQVSQVAELADLIVLGRNREPIPADTLKKAGFSKSRVSTLANFDYPVSSTDVRARLEAGDFPSEDLPVLVADYIKSNSLYQQS